MQSLDDPIWHALAGPHATVAEVHGAARRYPPTHTVFAALADDTDAGAWADLATLVGPDGTAIARATAPGPGWTELGRFDIAQMVASDVAPGPAPDGLVELGPDDVAAMTELVHATEPGPWRERTHELGAFVGVVRDGRLVAMAGRRMRLDDAVEISAVCTDPAARGLGLATALTTLQAARILGEGRTPFLHVLPDNAAAIRAYERAGFRRRATIAFGAYEAPPAPGGGPAHPPPDRR